MRYGIWIEKFNLDTIDYYKNKGRYKLDDKKGIWRYYQNKVLIKKEYYKKDSCLRINYHLNKKIASIGYTKTEINDKLIHWFYSGKWLYYDQNGKLIETRIYNKDGLKTTKLK